MVEPTFCPETGLRGPVFVYTEKEKEDVETAYIWPCYSYQTTEFKLVHSPLFYQHQH
jgi:hypothetical protein